LSHRFAVAFVVRGPAVGGEDDELNEQGNRTDETAAISLALDAIRRVANANKSFDATHPSPP
jgi:hypothetical protein